MKWISDGRISNTDVRDTELLPSEYSRIRKMNGKNGRGRGASISHINMLPYLCYCAIISIDIVNRYGRQDFSEILRAEIHIKEQKSV